jgi:hypothetical protein
MCGAVRTDAGSCHSCGESFALTVQRKPRLPIGLLPGAIVGASAGLVIGAILVITEWPTEFRQIVFGSFLCASIGTVVGLGRAAVVRVTSRRLSEQRND